MKFGGEFQSHNAPSNTYSEIAAGTGSYVSKEILTRPSLVKIGEIDYSGWYGTDYYQSTIQEGSPKSIFMESVQPRVIDGVISEFNMETQYYYSSSLSSSLTLYYSSSRVSTDFDTKYQQHIGTNRAFYLGSKQTVNTTVKDGGQRWDNQTAAVEVYLTSPTKLMTTDSPNNPLDVVTNR